MKENIQYSHISVRKNESIEALKIKKNGIYVDCTFGRGGHSLMILEQLSNEGHLYCFDQDHEAEQYFNKHFLDKKNCTFIKANFKDIKFELEKRNIFKVDGILYDLGVSSPMFDNPERGFSYKNDARLDMRMDNSQTKDAHFIINNYSKQQLINVFKDYGEIYNCGPVVDLICEKRSIKPIDTTIELVEIIRQKTPIKLQYQKKHFARTYFQALRIEVNNELDVLKKSLEDSLDLLNISGRIVVISFHSLEEKVVKNTFMEALNKNNLPKEIPINNQSDFKLIKIKHKPSKEEVEENHRSRSAFLKVIERIKNE